MATARRTGRGLFMVTLVLVALTGPVGAQAAAAEPPPTPAQAGPDTTVPVSAAALFEQTLARQGLTAATTRLRQALADTTSAYEVEPLDLLRLLPTRLVLSHRRDEALALLQALEGRFGDSGPYWVERASAHLRCGDSAGAGAALGRAQALMPDRPDLPWMLARLEGMVATARLQAQREDALVPGQPTGLDGPYFGQPPPGRTPEVFAPGYVCGTGHEYHISFTPDGREIWFSRGGAGTLVARWREGGWTAPEVVHLIDADHLTEEANVTPDGRAIVFCGRRTLREERVLYRAERKGEGWGTPVRLFPGMYATATLDGTLYHNAPATRPDYGVIVRRPWAGEGYGEPVVVEGEGINSPAPDAHPFVAPDGSVLLFDSYREPGAGIYASFRQQDGGWGKAILLNDILGIPPAGQCALSPDGRCLFFCLAGDMYWVDAGFLQDLRSLTFR